MNHSSIVNFYVIFTSLSIFVNIVLTTTTPMFSSDLIQRGMDVCSNHVSFCTIEKQSSSSRSCCFQCSCFSSCYEKGECCPDIANATFKFKHSCQSVYYKNPEYWRRQTEIPLRSYEMVTACQDGTDCSVDFSQFGKDVHRDDLVAVYTEPDLVIFKNRRCAECNGVQHYKKWRLVASDCMFRDNVPANMSGTEMFQHMLTNCILYSFPEKSIADDLYQHTCDRKPPDIVITACNMTGRQNFINDIILRGCTDDYLTSLVYHPYIDEIYKNVFCFMCNNKEGESIPAACYDFARDRFTTEFVEIMDLQTDFSSLKEIEMDKELCEENEFYDEMFDMCRAVVCPRLNYFSDGICKNPPFKMSSKYIYKFNVMLFPVETISPTMQLGKINHQNLLSTILDVTAIRDICQQFGDNSYLKSVIGYFHRDTSSLHYLFAEVYVFVIEGKNCTEDNVGYSLQSIENGFEINITISVDQEREDTIRMTLISDNRTQIRDSRERLAPYNKTHLSEILYEANLINATNTVIETPYLCPHVTLDEAEYSRLVSEVIETESYTADTIFANRHSVIVKSFVNSYDDYFNDQIYRTYSICLDQYKLIAAKPKNDSTTVMGTLSLVLSCISMVCSMVILLLFCIAKKINNGPMALFACALVNIFIAQGVFQFGSGWNDKPVLCQAIGIGVHYFWLASVFALNAYCFLILRQLVSVKTKICNSDLIISLVYVFGLPACFILVNIVYSSADTSSPTGSGYGDGQCHINTALMRGLLFALPIFFTVASSIMINCMIAVKIKHTQSTVSNTRREARYAIVFFRLLIVAGITWVFGILKEVVTSTVLDYCFVVFVAGQGIFLLFSFVCRHRFIQELRKEFQSRKSDRFLAGTTTNSSEIFKQGTQETN